MVLKKIRALIDQSYPNKVLLAEANKWPEDVRPYFGDGDECHMAFHFPLMPRMYMAIAQEDRHPLVEIMQQTPEIPDICQWAIFLRNHDELTLEMVTSRERDYMYRMYAADVQARINLGIRRRLAPLMENDPERIKLMNSLLLSMPGSPIIYYGDEIGMGDNIYLGDRNGVRTPMQWSPDRNAGFSRADPQRLYLPPIMDPVYGYQAVNVEAQERDPGSLLNWMKRMLRVRARKPRVRPRAALEFLKPGNRKILAYLREYGDEAILCVANLARSAQPVELDLRRFKGRVPVELLGRTSFPPIGDLPYLLTLPAHAFYWFRLATDVEAPSWHTQMIVSDEVPILVLFDGWLSFFRDKVVPWRMRMAEQLREQLEEEVLPRLHLGAALVYLERRAGAGRAHPGPRGVGGRQLSWLLLLDVGRDLLPAHGAGWEDDEEHVRARRHVARREQANVGVRRASPTRCSAARGEGDGEGSVPTARHLRSRRRQLAQSTIVRVRQQANVGVVGDAMADEGFCRNVVKAMGENRSVATERGSIRFTPTGMYREIAGGDLAGLTVGRLQAQSTNTSVTLSRAAFPEVLPQSAARREPGAGGRPLPDRGGPLSELRSGGRRGGVPERAGRAGHLGAAAGLRTQPGRRLELHARLPAALSRDAARHAGGEPRRLPARSSRRWRRAPRSCTARSPRPPRMRRSRRSRSPAPTSRR